MSGIGGWLAERHTWSYPFYMVGGAGVFYALVLFFTLCDAPRVASASGKAATKVKPAHFGQALVTLLSRGSFLLVLTYYALAGFVGWMVLGWMPTFVQERFHLGQGAAGFSANGYVNVAGLAGVFIGGILADRWTRTRPRGCILVPAIALCLAAPGIFLTANVPILFFAMFGLVAFGLAGGFSDANMMPILCIIADSRYRASAYGLLNFVACLSGGVAVFVGGRLQDLHFGLGQILSWSALLMLLCPLMLFMVRPPAGFILVAGELVPEEPEVSPIVEK
jgi:predicted MFS family arabinose efflux permease